jgi:hypothetical protein
MPGFDKTGPLGGGPMTGGAGGVCRRSGDSVTGNIGGFGYGRGRACRRSAGYGFGRGMGRSRYPLSSETVSEISGPEMGEIKMLRTQIDQLSQTLSTLQQRMSELDQ